MTPYKFLSRNHKFEITTDASPYTSATWIPISGINEWGWEEDTNDEDVSDFDNAGWNSSIAVSKGATLSLNGWYLIDEATGVRDTGQSTAETAAHKLGQLGFRGMRVRARDTADTINLGSITVQASLKMSENYGGSTDDVQKFAVECMVQGRPVGSGCYNVFS